ncbi:MAG: sulfotransferase [Gemmatimonadota bacterium]
MCGPPRSGTTVVALTLARSLDVAFVTNLTSIFPRAPITMSRLFRADPDGGRLALRSHYGRTAGMLGWNDGLHLWDRWVGADRTAADIQIDDARGREMERFFGAYEEWSKRPLLMKNNGLLLFASEVARHLPTATFLCLRREPVYLAQSLLVARSYIHGDDAIPYGRDDPERVHHEDPVLDVCEQVRSYAKVMDRCRTELGPDRFRLVSYEEFCSDPAGLVKDVAENVLDLPVLHERVPAPLEVSTKQRLPDETFARLEAILEPDRTE